MGAGNPKFRICVVMSAGCVKVLHHETAGRFHVGVAAADGSSRAIRLVDSGVGQANIVENRLNLLARNLAVQFGFDLVAHACGLLHAQSGPGAHVQAQQSGIDLREEVLPQEPQQTQ